jgi:lipopolysaccharide transport system permease protein
MSGDESQAALVIEPRRRGAVARLREAWSYRRIVRHLGKRLVQKLYRRTWLGPVWILIRPLSAVAGSLFVFGGVLKVGSEGLPYAVFFLTGMSTWQLFAASAFWATRSLELNRRFLRSIYVPRLLVLLSSLAIPLLFFGIYFVMTSICLWSGASRTTACTCASSLSC